MKDPQPTALAGWNDLSGGATAPPGSPGAAPPIDPSRSSVIAACIRRLRRLARTGLRILPVLAALIGVVTGAAVVVIFALNVLASQADRVPEVDSYGYVLIARALADGELPRWRDDHARFRGHVWVRLADGQVTSKYPPGWPALMALGYRANGAAGAMAVNTTLAIVGAVAFFLLAWMLFGAEAAALCSALWLFSPMLLMYAVYPLSHSADITFVLLAMLAAIAWGRTRWTFFAACCGLCAGLLPAIRPASVLMWPAVLGMMAATRWETGHARHVPGQPPQASPLRWCTAPLRLMWRHLRARRRWRRLIKRHRGAIAFTAAALVPLTLLLAYNTALFGAPWRTGYSLSGEDSGFDHAQWTQRLSALASQRTLLLGSAAWALALLGVILRSGRTALLWALLLWFVPTLWLHLGYYWWPGPGAVFQRFLLSAAPALVLCAGFAVRNVWYSFAPARALLAVAAVWLVLGIIAEPARIMSIRARPVRAGADLADLWQAAQTPPANAAAQLGNWLTAQQTTIGEASPSKPTIIFATGAALWTAGALPGVIGIDLEAWQDRHFRQPPTAACERPSIRQDSIRHRWLHEHTAALAAAPGGLPQDFDNRVTALLDEDHTVLVIAPPQDPLLQRAAALPGCAIEATDQHVLGLPLTRLRRAPSAPATLP